MLKSPQSVAVAAFIAAVFTHASVSVSAPTFAGGHTVNTTTEVNRMVMGDFDGDGIPDVAMIGRGSGSTNYSVGQVEVHFGNGTNGFRPGVAQFEINLGYSDYSGLASADLSGAGHSDLIIPAGNAVLIYDWTGSSFSQSRSIDLSATGINAYRVAVGNLTSTNSRDIVVTDDSGAVGVVWIPNDGHGNFGAPAAFGETGGYTGQPVLADVNGDKLDDVILLADGSGNTAGVLLNNGHGGLEAETLCGNSNLFSIAGTLLRGVNVTVADVDGDGKPDLISACDSHNISTFEDRYYLSVNLGNGDGTFQDGKPFTLNTGVQDMAAATLSNSNRSDIVTVDYVDSGFSVTSFSGAGDSLAVAEQVSFPADGTFYNCLTLGYNTPANTFATFNDDTNIDVLLGTSSDLFGTDNQPHSQIIVFQNTTPGGGNGGNGGQLLPPTTLFPIEPTIPGGYMHFTVQQTAVVPGMIVRVQYSLTPTNEASWTDLPDGNSGHLRYNRPGFYIYPPPGASSYPAGTVYFRAITSALGYVDSISAPTAPFTLEQGQFAIGVGLVSTSDPTGAQQIAHVGDNLTYTLAWTNNGDATATSVRVETPIPTYISAADNLQYQFARGNLTFNQYGHYVSSSAPGALDAKVWWNVSNLKPGFVQTVPLVVHLPTNVRISQQIGLPNSYRVYSASHTPPTQATGFSSGASNVEMNIEGPIRLTVTPSATHVAPGGLISYTLEVHNLSSYTAKNVVIADPAPEFTWFDPVGTKFLAPAVAPKLTVNVNGKFVTASNPMRIIGALPASSLPLEQQAFLGANPLITSPTGQRDQAVFYIGSLTKGASATVQFTVQAQFVDPADVTDHEIKNFDYIAFFEDPNGDIVSTKNESGNIFTPVQGAVKNAPNLSLGKLVNPTTVTPGQTFAIGFAALNSGPSAAEDVFIQDRLPAGATLLSQAADQHAILPGASVADLSSAIGFLGTSASTRQSQAQYFVTLDPDGTFTMHGLHIEPKSLLGLFYNMQIPTDTAVPPTLDSGTSFIGADNGSQSVYETGTNPPVIVSVPPGTPIDVPIHVSSDVQLVVSPNPAEGVLSPRVSSDPNATAAQLDALYKTSPNASLIVKNSKPPANIPGVQRYIIKYQNAGTNIAADVHVRWTVPANTEFYRAALWANGMVAPLAANQSSNVPARLGTGNVTFNLGDLNGLQGGGVMVEAILLSSGVNINGSRVPVAAPLIYSGAAPMERITPQKDDAATNFVGTIVYDGQNVPSFGVLKVGPQEVRSGESFDVQFAIVNYGDVFIIVSPRVTVTAPAGTEIVSVDPGSGSIFPVGSNSTSVTVGYNSVGGPHTAGALRATFRVLAQPGTDITENCMQAVTDYAGTFQAVPTTIHVVAANASIPHNTITSVSGMQFVTLGEVAVVPIGHDSKNVSYVLVSGPGTSFDALTPNKASILCTSGNANLIIAGDASGIPLVGLPVVANLSTSAALAKLSTLVSMHGANIFNGPEGNIVAADGETVMDNRTGLALATIKEMLAAGAISVLPSGAATYSKSGAALLPAAAAVGSGSVSAKGGGFIITVGGGVVSNDGGSIISQDGSGVVSNDGGSFVGQNGSSALSKEASQIISQDGSGIISQDGSGLISSKNSIGLVQTAGGNIVAAGGGNIVAAGGGNIVAAGGGN